jgi:hypothetical protein
MNLHQRRVVVVLIIGGALGLVATIIEPNLQEITGLLSGGAIGVLLVYGYERWIKRA